MLDWNQLHKQLGSVSKHHSQLAAKFLNFARYVQEQVTDNTFQIKGISVSLHIEDGYFTTAFAGRTLRFSFSPTISENGSLVGNVTCILTKDFPEKLFVPVGEFTFTGNGKTNIVGPDGCDLINIDNDAHAICVTLNFIHESLSK